MLWVADELLISEELELHPYEHRHPYHVIKSRSCYFLYFLGLLLIFICFLVTLCNVAKDYNVQHIFGCTWNSS